MLIDSSMITTYMSCPKKFYFKYVKNRISPIKSNGASFGIALHKARHCYLIAKDRNNALQDALTLFLSEWTDIEGDDLRTSQRGLELFTKWAELYPNPEVFASEVGFAVPLNKDITYCGKIDTICKISGRWSVVDFKTGRCLPLKNDYTNSIQLTGYLWASQILFKSLDIRDVYIDFLQIAKTKSDISLRMQGINSNKLNQFKDLVCYYTQNISENKFNMNWNSCKEFGGCSYIEVCTLPYDMQDEYLERTYELHETRPYEQGNK